MTRPEVFVLPGEFDRIAAGVQTHLLCNAKKRNLFKGNRYYASLIWETSFELIEGTPCPKCNGTNRVWDNGDTTHCGCPAPHWSFTGRALELSITCAEPVHEKIRCFTTLDDEWFVLSISLLKRNKKPLTVPLRVEGQELPALYQGTDQ